ncbi:nucleotidyltransferase family protein [Winogradskyella forsetii]|uniref:nucleotidyltransferase family protein n=1 Tax=Winogradskyella forsetii TaxID=2686077 RepID=UPI0015BC3EA1|nr:nucleotidyltransferase family protein [Winogradskyella forsetii]
MGKLAITYQHIADILSFEVSNSQLEETLKNPAFNWDPLVVEGSKHLVLPAIYCRLKARKFLHLLPTDLKNYLEELTNINRNRNKALLSQVRAISKLLNEHHIEHVFLKGAALLASGCYHDNAERMVGDIDILVKKDQVYTAFNLLKSNGYDKSSGYAYDTIEFRHLDKLISENELASIEIHSHLLNRKYRSLIDLQAILNTKNTINGIAIPRTYDLSMHQILSWQLNDKGHYYKFPNFKIFYDIIKVNSDKDEALVSDLMRFKYGKSFLEIAKFYFKEFSHIQSNSYMIYISLSHKTLMNYKPLRVFVRKGKYALNFLLKRLHLLLTNTSYTRHIFKKVFNSKSFRSF